MRYAAWAATFGCAMLTACGHDASPPPNSVPHFKLPSGGRKGPTAEELTVGMASAPTIGKASLPVDLKFELGGRPKLGQAVQINLALVSKIDGGPATLELGDNGPGAGPGDPEFEVPLLETGAVYRHTLSMTPAAEGVQLVNLKVTIKHDDISESQIFTVPLIVER